MLKKTDFIYHTRSDFWKGNSGAENCNKIHNQPRKSFIKDVWQLIFMNRGTKLSRGDKLIFAKTIFLWFGEGITQRMNDEMNVGNCRKYIADNYLKIETIINLKCHAAVFLLQLETRVRFRGFSYEILEKYMQTKEPFHSEVGYNILGEGQQFVDEKNSSTYNNNELPILAINHLYNRMKKNSLFSRGT